MVLVFFQGSQVSQVLQPVGPSCSCIFSSYVLPWMIQCNNQYFSFPFHFFVCIGDWSILAFPCSLFIWHSIFCYNLKLQRAYHRATHARLKCFSLFRIACVKIQSSMSYRRPEATWHHAVCIHNINFKILINVAFVTWRKLSQPPLFCFWLCD